MSFPNLPAHFQPAFRNRWEHRLQREMSLLMPWVTKVDVKGYRKKLDSLEKQSMREISARAGATTVDEATAYVRWLNVHKYELTNRLDEWDDDELGDLILPDGRLTENHVFGYHRACDTRIVAGIEGVAYTGEDGTTETSVPNSQTVAADFTKAGTSVTSGFIFDKVARAKKIFRSNAAMRRGSLCCAIGPLDEEDLVVNVTEIRNSDYTKAPAIDNGEVDGLKWFGINWIVGDDDLLTTASSVTNCLMWIKEKVYLGDGQRRASLDTLPEHSHALQIRTRARIGATREEEKAVVIIKSSHA